MEILLKFDCKVHRSSIAVDRRILQQGTNHSVHLDSQRVGSGQYHLICVSFLTKLQCLLAAEGNEGGGQHLPPPLPEGHLWHDQGGGVLRARWATGDHGHMVPRVHSCRPSCLGGCSGCTSAYGNSHSTLSTFGLDKDPCPKSSQLRT